MGKLWVDYSNTWMGKSRLRKVHGGIIGDKGPWANGVKTWERNYYKWKE